VQHFKSPLSLSGYFFVLRQVACSWSVVLSASSTTKTGRHDIAEILLKVALKHQQQKIKSKSLTFF
jgi:hypothetical protein